MNVKAIENYRPFQVFRNYGQFSRRQIMQLWYYEIKIKKWKFFFSPIPGDSLKSMKKNEIIVIHSKKTFEIVYFLVAWVTFYNFQLTFLFADTMAPFKRYEQLRTGVYISEGFSYPKVSFLLFIFFLTPSTSM